MVRRGERGSDRERVAREEIEFIEKVVYMNRVAKVVRGGRRFSLSTLVVVGDGKGRIGVGSGKARESTEAIHKATEKAKLSLVRIPMRGHTLYHDVKGHFGAGKVILRSAARGTGIIAGGAMRAMFEALGVQDVVAKSIGTSNPHNVIKATLHALKQLMSPRQVAEKRNKSVRELRMYAKQPRTKHREESTANAVVEATAKPVEESTANAVVEATAKPVEENTANAVVEATAKPVEESTVNAVVEATAKPVEENTANAVVEATAKPVEESTVNAVVEATAKPVEESTANAVVEATAKPVEDTKPSSQHKPVSQHKPISQPQSAAKHKPKPSSKSARQK